MTWRKDGRLRKGIWTKEGKTVGGREELWRTKRMYMWTKKANKEGEIQKDGR
jgi:hypothetical protein